MDFIESIILGIIQGLTEFLPVSSSGHLEIAKWILDDESISEQSLMFTVILHFGTALSTIIVFWKDIKEIVAGLFKRNTSDWNFAMMIVISMIPAAVVGVLFDDIIESLFSGKILLVAIMLILTGLILYVADRAKSTDKDVTWKEAIIIGIAQMVAILPGISRSGATISTSVLLGIDRYKAARFSFLMVVPLIFGKIAKDLLSDEFSVSREVGIELVIGFLAAFFTGIIACKWMIALVRKSQLKYFSFYCFAVGLIVIAVSLFLKS